MQSPIKMIAFGVALLTFSAMSSSSDKLVGGDDPDLRTAIDLWLDNDDENSLSQLANLARSGNIAARLLLSRIERTERAPSAYREHLTIEEHKALFRNPNKRGLFSLSWMLSESESGNELARLFLLSYKPLVNLEAIRGLQSHGEIEATDHPVRIAALYGSEREKKTILSGLGAPQMHPFVKSLQSPPRQLADGLSALEYILQFSDQKPLSSGELNSFKLTTARFLALGIPYGDISIDNPWRSSISHWLATGQETLPIRNACKLACGDNTEQCSLTLLGLTGGFYEAIRLDSPIENLISQESFLNSPRAASQAMRRGALIRAEYGGEIATLPEIANSSQCLATQVEVERASPMYQSTATKPKG